MALVAVVVQLIAVSLPYDQIDATAPRLAAVPVYDYLVRPSAVPLGDDSVRWIPQLSPIIIQGTFLVSRIGEQFGAAPITY